VGRVTLKTVRKRNIASTLQRVISTTNSGADLNFAGGRGLLVNSGAG